MYYQLKKRKKLPIVSPYIARAIVSIILINLIAEI